jgi:glycosyltransferase involved in cell wall biosynthesis
MKIGIDARTLNVKGGTRTYAQNILDKIGHRDNIILYGIEKFKDYVCINSNGNQLHPINRLIWDFITLPNLLDKHDITLYHGLKGNIPIFSKCKKIVTVHDTISFSYPEHSNKIDYVYWRYFIPYCIKKADHIIAVSKSTKNDLAYFLKISPDKISVIYEAYDDKTYTIFNKKDCYKRIKQFLDNKSINVELNDSKIILNVNTIQPRKNIVGIIKAFNQIAHKDNKSKLLICGKKGWKTQDICAEYNRSPFKDRILFLGFVPDQIVADLYNISHVFIYPSFYEGFGLPILEAQACGCPVIASNVSSMPEVAGDGAILVDPYSVEEMANAISEVISNEESRDSLTEKGLKNCNTYSWKKCAEETMKIYEEVYNGG